MSFDYGTWDERVYSSIVLDDPAGGYRMFYTAYGSDVVNDYGPATAVSDDLVTWTKPNVGEIDYPTVAGNTNNNLVIFRDNDTPTPLELADVIWAENQYLALCQNKVTAQSQLYKSPDGEVWTFVQNAFTGYFDDPDWEYAEPKAILYDGSTYKLFYGWHGTQRRTLGYYESATFDGSFVDQGIRPEFTSTDQDEQYYDMFAWEHAGAWWANIVKYNKTTEILGPHELWRSTDTGETWTQRGNLIENGAGGTFDDELIAAGKPILVDGLWHMMYVGSSEGHDNWPRPMVFAWATSSSLEGPVITFDAPFYQTKSLTPLIGPAGACTRAGSAGHYDSAGVWQYAGANTAAFAHDPVTAESLGLSVFETRTNLVPQPESFDNVAWTVAGATVDADAADFIDGNTSMDRLNVTASSSLHRIFDQITLGAGTQAEVSCFFKDDGARYVGLNWLAAANDWCTVVADLTLETVTQESEGATSGTIADSGIEGPDSNGVYRLWMIAACAAANPFIVPQTHSSGTPSLDTSGNETFLGVAGNDVFLCGAHAAAGSFLTPYAPTAHNDDDIDWSDVSWYNDSAGTWYFKVRPADLSADNYIIAMVNGAVGADGFILWFDLPTGTLTAFRGTTTGDDGLIQMAAVAAVDTWIEIAIAYENNDMVMYVDGVAGTPDTSVTVPPTNASDNMKLGRSEGGVSLVNGYFAHARYDATRLPDPTVQSWSRGVFANKRAGIGLSMGKMGM